MKENGSQYYVYDSSRTLYLLHKIYDSYSSAAQIALSLNEGLGVDYYRPATYLIDKNGIKTFCYWA